MMFTSAAHLRDSPTAYSMAYDATFLLNVKNLVTDKLKALGAFIDDELPDYVMVMVANKKSESSMAKDLQLFLGEHTKVFTEWLHSTLKSIKQQSHDSDNDKKNEVVIKRQIKGKIQKRKSQKNQLAEADKDFHRTNSHSRSRSPIISREIRNSSYSREPHAETDLVSLDATEDEFSAECNPVMIPVKEERKIISTSSLRKKKSDIIPNEVKLGESLGVNSLRSIVQIKDSKSVKVSRLKNKSEISQPTSLLLKRAVTEAKASTDGSDYTYTQPKRKLIARPIACSDVSSSSHPDSTQFFITLSGPESNSVQAISPVSYSRVKACIVDNANMSAKSRLGSRYLNSTSPNTNKRISVKQRLGPIVQSSERPTNTNYDDKDYAMEENELDRIVEGDYVELSYDDSFDELPEGISQKIIAVNRDLLISAPKMNLADRLSQSSPQLVVNLNETDEDEDTTNMIMDAERQNKILVQKKQSVQPSTEHKQLDKENDDGQPNIPSSLERCKFWPNCRNGTNCQFIHPTEPCPTFPRCKFGATCTFIHPQCRYDALCSRRDCPFTHSAKRVTPALTITPNQIVCKFQGRCVNIQCPFYHPPMVPRIPVIPQFVNSAATVFSSPVPCRFGSACANRLKCPFLHTDIPKVNQLKWIAPSKKPNSSCDSSELVAATHQEDNKTQTSSETI